MMEIYDALVKFAIWLSMWFGIAIAISCIATNLFGIGTDDSDLDKSHRSGVRVVTDYKTGLQYLETSKGGITPRLDAKGNQVSVKDIGGIK
jgi:hypothetical protein